MVAKIPTNEMTQIENTTPSKKVRRMFGLDLDSWNAVMVSFLGVAAIAATVVVISTAIVIKLQKITEEQTRQEFDRYKIEAGEKISAANAIAESAKADAEKAHGEIAKANAETAKAVEGAAKANAAALEAKAELAKFKAQRVLSIEQQQRVAAAIKPFKNIKFDVAIGISDLDAELLLGPIELALAGGDWVQIDWQDKTPAPVKYDRPGRPSVGSVGAVGVIVEISPSKFAEHGEAAKALALALNAEGIGAVAQDASSSAANPDAIHVLIGRKPQ